MGGIRKLRRKNHRGQYTVEPLRQEAPFSFRKISEVILDFAGPLLDMVDDDELYESVIGFAVICWNLSFLPHQEQHAMSNAISDKLGKSDLLAYPQIENWVWIMLERKRTLFADDRRFVTDYSITGEGDHHHLLVMAVLAKD
jgi:hypothetical protein